MASQCLVIFIGHSSLCHKKTLIYMPPPWHRCSAFSLNLLIHGTMWLRPCDRDSLVFWYLITMWLTWDMIILDLSSHSLPLLVPESSWQLSYVFSSGFSMGKTWNLKIKENWSYQDSLPTWRKNVMIAGNFPLGAVTQSARLSMYTCCVYHTPHPSISVVLDFYALIKMSFALLDVVVTSTSHLKMST